MKINFRKLCLFFVLLENLYLPIKLGFDFRVNYLLYFAFILIYPFTFRTVSVRKISFQSIVLILMLLIAIPLLNGSGVVESGRQVILISFNCIFGFLLINAYKYDFEELFKDYVDLIYIAAIVGIIQIVSQFVGFRYGADYSYLGFDMQHFNMGLKVIQSWFQEPSFLAISFIPAAFVAICRLMGITDMITRKKSIIILSVLVLSQSAIGLLGLVLSLGLVMLKKYSILRSPRLSFLSGILFVIISLGLYSIPKVQIRVNDTAKLFYNDRVSAQDIESTNMSTYAIYSNFKIVQATFADRPIFGSGLGTYESDYYKYVKVVMPPNRMTETVALNERDANSLLLRVTAELGLFGLFLMGWFIFTNRIRGVDLNSHSQALINYWVINSAVYVLILSRLIRMGHYTTLGFVLFLMIYYISKRAYERTLKHNLEEK